MQKVLLILTVVLGLAFVTSSCGGDAAPKADAPAAKTEAKAETKPEAKPEAKAEPAVGDPAKGKELFDTKCMACHLTGVTGSPKLTETERWATIASQGMDVLMKHALEGFQGEQGLMPPKGGFADLSEGDIRNAITFMLQEAGATAK